MNTRRGTRYLSCGTMSEQKLRGRLGQEFKTVQAMIRLYCRAHHKSGALCADCSQLLAHASQRLGACRFGQEKPTCQNCTVHCYHPRMKERIRQVMRYSGPRLLLRHPILALSHVLRSSKGR